MASPIQPDQSQVADTTIAPNPADSTAQQPYANARANFNFDQLSTAIVQPHAPEEGVDRPEPGKVAAFFHGLWETAKSGARALAGSSFDARARVMGAAGDPEARASSQAIVRGSVKAVTQTAETALTLGQHLDPNLMAVRNAYAEQAQAGNQDAAAVVAAIDKPITAVQSLEDHIVHSEALGGNAPVSQGDKGLEGLSQFATGMLLYGRYLKVGTGLLTRIGGLSLQAGAVSGISFNPRDPRISNQLAQVPWAGQHIAQVMSANETDDALLARAKEGVEGAITNLPLTAGMEGLSSVLRFLMPARKAVQTALLTRAARSAQLQSELGVQAAQVDVQAAEQVAARVHPDDAVDVVQTAEGNHAVVPTTHFADGKVPDVVEEGSLPADVLKFKSEPEANAMAAAINTARKNNLVEPGDVEPAFTRGDNPQAPADLQKQIGETNSGVGNAPVNPAGAQDYIERTLASMAPEVREQWLARNVNMNYLQTDESVGNVITRMGEFFQKLPALSDEELAAHARDISESIGVTPEAVVNFAESLAGKDIDKLPAIQLGLRSFLLAQARKVGDLGHVVDLFPENAVAQANLSQALDTAMRLYKRISLNATGFGRGLRQQRITVGEGAQLLVTTAKDSGEPAFNIAQYSPEERAALARMMAMSDDPAGMLASLSEPRTQVQINKPVSTNKLINAYRTARDWATSWFMEGILSGPTTHMVNSVSNATMGVLRPVETYFSGMAPGVEAALRRTEGTDLLVGLWTEMGDAMKMAGKAFRDGTPTLNPSSSRTASVSIGRFGETAGGRGGLLGWLSTILHMPSRALMSADEFFSQLSYRSKLRADILSQARAEGITDPSELATRLATQQRFGFNSQGMSIYDKAQDYANYVTFKGQLDPSNGIIEHIGSSIQGLVGSHPELRFIVPFVRTPTKIFEVSLDHTPVLGLLQKSMREDFAAGGSRRAMALAQQAMGTSILVGTWMAAKSGLIVGRGPTDPVQNRQWREIDKRMPYSFKTPFGWVQYRRLGPPFQLLGMMSDWVSMSGELSDQQNSNAAGTLLAALTANMVSQTYARGPVDFLDAATSGDPNKWTNLLENNFVAPAVPNAVALGNPDRFVRETQHWWDAIVSRVPGWSESLEPRRNLFGEKILKGPGYLQHALNPFTTMEVSKSPQVAQAMIDLGKNLGSMPNKKQNGVDWSDRTLAAGSPHADQSPYDRWLELMDQPQGGRTTRQEVEQFITSPQYAHMEDGIRTGRAASIVQRRLAQARSRVLSEYPALRDAMRAARVQQQQQFRQSSQSPTADQTEQLLTP